jgi:chemotaxis methyl-accepting protein methylase
MRETLRKIIEELTLTHGVDVSKYEGSFLERAFEKRIAKTGCGTASAYLHLLKQARNEGDEFINSLNISYTEFFRNSLTFSVLERIILPLIAIRKENNNRSEVRVWTAACAAGQEAYSLAILLEELKKSDSEKNIFRIFATDQSEAEVNIARMGEYSSGALANITLKRMNQWFNKTGDTFSVKPELKKNIDFSVFDLFNSQLCCPPSSIFGDFDLIVCANLLFYYKPEYQKVIIEKAGSCLAKDGFLVTGEAEREILLTNNYREVISQSAIFQKMERG